MLRHLFGCLILMLCFVLAACGGGGDETSDADLVTGGGGDDVTLPFDPGAGGGSGGDGGGGGVVDDPVPGGGSGGGGGSTTIPDQGGLLTAGSYDDASRPGILESWLRGQDQQVPVISEHLANFGQRRQIEVHGPVDQVGGLAVVVADAADPERVLLGMPTRTDGRLLLLTGLDGQAESYLVQVTGPAGAEIEATFADSDPQPWVVELTPATASVDQEPIDDEPIDDAPVLATTALDLAFVIDCTGSMGDELHYLQAELRDIVTTVRERFPAVDMRYGLVCYRDEGDLYVVRQWDFTASLDDFHTVLLDQVAAGGGDYPEAVHSAFAAGEQLTWRAGNVARLCFFVADAPPHDRHMAAAFTSALRLREQGVVHYPLAASGAADETEAFMRVSALATMGQYLFLTDHSGLGNGHAEPNVPSYQVEHLDGLMVRMIESELVGRRLLADPEDIIAEIGVPDEVEPDDPVDPDDPIEPDDPIGDG